MKLSIFRVVGAIVVALATPIGIYVGAGLAGLAFGEASELLGGVLYVVVALAIWACGSVIFDLLASPRSRIASGAAYALVAWLSASFLLSLGDACDLPCLPETWRQYAAFAALVAWGSGAIWFSRRQAYRGT